MLEEKKKKRSKENQRPDYLKGRRRRKGVKEGVKVRKERKSDLRERNKKEFKRSTYLRKRKREGEKKTK